MLECVGVVLLVGIPLLMPQKLEMIQQALDYSHRGASSGAMEAAAASAEAQGSGCEAGNRKSNSAAAARCGSEAENYDAGIYRARGEAGHSKDATRRIRTLRDSRIFS